MCTSLAFTCLAEIDGTTRRIGCTVVLKLLALKVPVIADHMINRAAAPWMRHTVTMVSLLVMAAFTACDARPSDVDRSRIPLLAPVRAEAEDTLTQALVRRQRTFLALLADPDRSGLAHYLEMSFTWGDRKSVV